MAQFTYTIAEQLHLESQCEKAWLYAYGDPSYSDAGYWRHCAGVAVDEGDEVTAQACIEQAESIECGMEAWSGETL